MARSALRGSEELVGWGGSAQWPQPPEVAPPCASGPPSEVVFPPLPVLPPVPLVPPWPVPPPVPLPGAAPPSIGSGMTAAEQTSSEKSSALERVWQSDWQYDITQL